MNHQLNKKYCIRHVNPDKLIGAAKKVPIQLLTNPSETLQRLLKDPKWTSLVRLNQFSSPNTLRLVDVKPILRLYTDYESDAKRLFSDETISRVKHILKEYSLLLRHVKHEDKNTHH